MATIKDVARAAGVSVTTVSATINDSAPVSATLRNRVNAAIAAVGYSPSPVARNLQSGSSRQIGLIVPNITTPSTADFTHNLQNILSDKGYSLFLASNDHDALREHADIQRMNEHQVAGIVLVPTRIGERYTQNLITVSHYPTIIVNDILPDAPFDCVVDDNTLGARLIGQHLLKLGHLHIAVIAEPAGCSMSDERLAGIRATLDDAGCPLDDDFVLMKHQREEQAYRATQDLMTRPNRPTAIITINAEQARGVVRALHDMQLKTPDDISLISFEDLYQSAGFEPQITTLKQDMQGIAEATADRLTQQMKARANATKTQAEPHMSRLPVSLVHRSSCRAV